MDVLGFFMQAHLLWNEYIYLLKKIKTFHVWSQKFYQTNRDGRTRDIFDAQPTS